MPADYGYIKGTNPERDGDAVDVYLGDDSHKATELPVWIVDQRHAHNLKFDEQKCMIGFPSAKVAHETYVNGFSDGKGQKRIGGVTRMTWTAFLSWVKNGDHKEPLSYHHTAKSALHGRDQPPYGAGTCPCARCRGKSGGTMSTSTVSEPKALGMLTGLMAKVMHRLTPEERTVMIQEAGAIAQSELGKASELLEMGDDHGRIGQVEDQWDGPPDDSLHVSGGHGPGSTAAPGAVNVGPSQAASGNGAEKMEREYSRHAPQGGVQAATEKLGREIAGMRGAMKSIFKALDAHAQVLEILKSAPAPTVTFDEAALTASILKAVTAATDVGMAKAAKQAVKKAMEKAGAVTPDTRTEAEIVAKAEEDSKDDDKEDEKEEGEGDEVEVEIEHEGKDEGEEKAKSMAAARYRVLARSRLKKAKDCIAKAVTLADKPLALQAFRKIAKGHIKKAEEYLTTGQMLRGGKVGPSTLDLREKLAKAKKSRKGVGASQAQNQDHWPASTEKEVGKGDAAPQVPTADLARAIDQISKAAEGMGMLNASVSQFMSAFGGKGAPMAPDGSGRLPPVFALAKAGGDKIAGVEMQLAKLHEDNIISFDDVQNAKDVLQRARMELPADIISTMVKRLPVPVQDVLNRAAA